MSPPSAEQVRTGQGRLPYQEAMGLTWLEDKSTDDGKTVRRYIGRRRAWSPRDDFAILAADLGMTSYTMGTGAYGGHVYSQASLAASMSLRASQKLAGDGDRGKKFGIHAIHGFFTETGRTDRPFIYEVTSLAANASFPGLLVTARQPTSPSTNPAADRYPAAADAALALGPVCFSAMVSFRPVGGVTQVDVQEPPPQTRFADILGSRRPAEWDPAPIADIAAAMESLPGSRHAVGTFPGLELRKVDMRAYNADRPFHERRELILYRLLAPLPATATTASNSEGGKDDDCVIDGPDAHISAHAYAADRNGLLMIGDHAGFGWDMARAASLSYSFVVHVDADEAVMTYGDDGDRDQWWVQETCFPRLHAGRGIVHCKIWSPSGVHVATEFQDGIIRRGPRPGDEALRKGGKL